MLYGIFFKRCIISHHEWIFTYYIIVLYENTDSPCWMCTKVALKTLCYANHAPASMELHYLSSPLSHFTHDAALFCENSFFLPLLKLIVFIKAMVSGATLLSVVWCSCFSMVLGFKTFFVDAILVFFFPTWPVTSHNLLWWVNTQSNCCNYYVFIRVSYENRNEANGECFVSWKWIGTHSDARILYTIKVFLAI